MSMTQAEYARHAKVHPSTVGRWLEVGRISLGPDGRIDPAQADREREATESPMPHHQARKAQIDEAKAAAKPEPSPAQPPAAPPDNLPTVERLGVALKMETYRLQKAKAEVANLEIDRLSGALVERDKVDRVLADFGVTLRGMLEKMPYREAPAIAAHKGSVDAIQAALEGIASDILAELTAHMRRKLETIAK